MVTLDSLVMQSKRIFRHGDHVTPDDHVLSDQAIHWRVRLQAEDITDEERRAFEEWKNQSSRHRAAYEKIDLLWRDLDDPSRIVWEEVQQGIEPADAVPLRPSSRGLLRWTRPAVIAASVVLVMLGGLWFTDYRYVWAPSTFRTAQGEHTTVTLQDGSTVHLNTSTTISVEFTDHRRHIVLKRGEAWFTVTPDRSRPFDVDAGNGTTRAVGTEFNVRQHADGATVTVIEGTVEVSQSDSPAPSEPRSSVASLTAGEQVRYSTRTGLGAVSQADLVQATGWRRGQLVFDLKPLGEVVEEVDRYWPGKILVMSPDLRRHRISGVFKAGDPDAVVHALETTFHMKSMTVAGYLIILYQ